MFEQTVHVYKSNQTFRIPSQGWYFLPILVVPWMNSEFRIRQGIHCGLCSSAFLAFVYVITIASRYGANRAIKLASIFKLRPSLHVHSSQTTWYVLAVRMQWELCQEGFASTSNNRCENTLFCSMVDLFGTPKPPPEFESYHRVPCHTNPRDPSYHTPYELSNWA